MIYRDHAEVELEVDYQEAQRHILLFGEMRDNLGTQYDVSVLACLQLIQCDHMIRNLLLLLLIGGKLDGLLQSARDSLDHLSQLLRLYLPLRLNECGGMYDEIDDLLSLLVSLQIRVYLVCLCVVPYGLVVSLEVLIYGCTVVVQVRIGLLLKSLRLSVRLQG